jgi:hypothetical protein
MKKIHENEIIPKVLPVIHKISKIVSFKFETLLNISI